MNKTAIESSKNYIKQRPGIRYFFRLLAIYATLVICLLFNFLITLEYILQHTDQHQKTDTIKWRRAVHQNEICIWKSVQSDETRKFVSKHVDASKSFERNQIELFPTQCEWRRSEAVATTLVSVAKRTCCCVARSRRSHVDRCLLNSPATRESSILTVATETAAHRTDSRKLTCCSWRPLRTLAAPSQSSPLSAGRCDVPANR